MSASHLLQLHRSAPLLTVVNVWDTVSARVVAATEGTRALATASHSIAASRGYADGENIPVAEMIEEVRRICLATDLPVTADLEAGYGDPGDTIRRAIQAGAVGANLEDQLTPLDQATAAVSAAMEAAAAEGVTDFVLNARTDVLLKPGDRPRGELLEEVVRRGQAYLEAGAPLVFVVGGVSEDEVATLVDAFGRHRLTLIGRPDNPPLARLEELGVARVSYGPMPQRVALTALQRLVEDIHAGGGVPEDMRPLN